MNPSDLPQTNGTPAHSQVVDIVRHLLAANGSKLQQIPIRDEQGKLIAHVIPAGLSFLVRVDLSEGTCADDVVGPNLPIDELFKDFGEIED
jgi:hypothetical protein